MAKTFKRKITAVIAAATCVLGSLGAMSANATNYYYSGTEDACGCWNEWEYSCTSVPFTGVSSDYMNDSHRHWTSIEMGGSTYSSATASSGNWASISKNRGTNSGVVVYYNNSGCGNPSTDGFLYWS